MIAFLLNKGGNLANKPKTAFKKIQELVQYQEFTSPCARMLFFLYPNQPAIIDYGTSYRNQL